jgi:hypothetical protein
MMRNIFCLIFCFLSTSVWAQDVEFLRVTCIPETRYLEVEYKAVPSDAVFIGTGFNEKEGKQRFDAWEKRGYFDPGKFRYECKLPDSTYLITSSRAPYSEQGMCGAQPRITLNLSRNGEKWLDNVVFGSDCFGGPSIMRISIRDGQEGWDTRNADLCIAPSGDSQEFCEYLSETYSGISTVMPLTQDELERYVEANRTSPGEKQHVEAKVWSKKLSLTKFKQEVCRFPNLELPPNTAIYAAGGYGSECAPLGHPIDPSGMMARRADVIVNEPNRPVVLMLGAHEPTVWNIEWTPGARILAVLASGSYGDAVSGLPKSTPVLLGWNYSKNKKVRACVPFYVESPKRIDKIREINKLSEDVFGRAADYIVHFDKNCKIHIGEPLSIGGKTITSPDTPPESFFNPKAPLAGKAGLIDAVAKGLLRKATKQDLKAWKKGESPGNSNASDESDNMELSTSYPWTSYVVLKPFVFPRGLYGPDAAIFYVPKGVPLPEGERGHSTIYDLNSMSCIGPMCNR